MKNPAKKSLTDKELMEYIWRFVGLTDAFKLVKWSRSRLLTQKDAFVSVKR